MQQILYLFELGGQQLAGRQIDRESRSISQVFAAVASA